MNQLESMKSLVAVIEQGGFSAAARRLGRSTASVTRHIQDLEAALGTRLLVRTTRRVHPTDTGDAYYQRCIRILEEVAEADALASEDALKPRGRLRVNAPVSFGLRRLQRLIPDYLKAYPEVRLDISLHDRRVALVEEGYDLVIRIGALQDSSLVARWIGSSRMILCASPAYLRGAPPLDTPGDLARHNCLYYSYFETSGRHTWLFSGPDGDQRVAIAGNCEINNGDLLAAAAEHGAGIVLQPDFIVEDAIAAGRLVPVLSEWDAGTLGIHAVYPHRRHLSARVRTFLDHLQQHLAPALSG
ncbi:LysR family transcriptional regulator [Aquisalimonas asiatica]|uniref:Transcriptional regulator, LysR family n=1 Tax=Aquisalimonas asiatica TaxID=406100 RepID=A0A1H8QNX2_9GAMM|nr:LysR family transcriptional regulator [Aquisalimonas asiatica]SEO55892.1 transcriptional regulator, LysR family [Aquisalimonas asiatica]